MVVAPVGDGGDRLTMQSTAHVEKGKCPLCGGLRYGGGGNFALALYLQGTYIERVRQSDFIPFQ